MRRGNDDALAAGQSLLEQLHAAHVANQAKRMFGTPRPDLGHLDRRLAGLAQDAAHIDLSCQRTVLRFQQGKVDGGEAAFTPVAPPEQVAEDAADGVQDAQGQQSGQPQHGVQQAHGPDHRVEFRGKGMILTVALHRAVVGDYGRCR